jgi:hypothetical protein
MHGWYTFYEDSGRGLPPLRPDDPPSPATTR